MNHQKIVYPSSCVFMQRGDIQKNIPIIYFNFQKEHFKSEANQKNLEIQIILFLVSYCFPVIKMNNNKELQ